eukprot:jgi/Mesvir1/21230/Mv06666-RA.1
MNVANPVWDGLASGFPPRSEWDPHALGGPSSEDVARSYLYAGNGTSWMSRHAAPVTTGRYGAAVGDAGGGSARGPVTAMGYPAGRAHAHATSHVQTHAHGYVYDEELEISRFGLSHGFYVRGSGGVTMSAARAPGGGFNSAGAGHALFAVEQSAISTHTHGHPDDAAAYPRPLPASLLLASATRAATAAPHQDPVGQGQASLGGRIGAHAQHGGQAPLEPPAALGRQGAGPKAADVSTGGIRGMGAAELARAAMLQELAAELRRGMAEAMGGARGGSMWRKGTGGGVLRDGREGERSVGGKGRDDKGKGRRGASAVSHAGARLFARHPGRRAWRRRRHRSEDEEDGLEEDLGSGLIPEDKDKEAEEGEGGSKDVGGLGFEAESRERGWWHHSPGRRRDRGSHPPRHLAHHHSSGSHWSLRADATGGRRVAAGGSRVSRRVGPDSVSLRATSRSPLSSLRVAHGPAVPVRDPRMGVKGSRSLASRSRRPGRSTSGSSNETGSALFCEAADTGLYPSSGAASDGIACSTPTSGPTTSGGESDSLRYALSEGDDMSHTLGEGSIMCSRSTTSMSEYDDASRSTSEQDDGSGVLTDVTWDSTSRQGMRHLLLGAGGARHRYVAATSTIDGTARAVDVTDASGIHVTDDGDRSAPSAVSSDMDSRVPSLPHDDDDDDEDDEDDDDDDDDDDHHHHHRLVAHGAHDHEGGRGMMMIGEHDASLRGKMLQASHAAAGETSDSTLGGSSTRDKAGEGAPRRGWRQGGKTGRAHVLHSASRVTRSAPLFCPRCSHCCSHEPPPSSPHGPARGHGRSPRSGIVSDPARTVSSPARHGPPSHVRVFPLHRSVGLLRHRQVEGREPRLGRSVGHASSHRERGGARGPHQRRQARAEALWSSHTQGGVDASYKDRPTVPHSLRSDDEVAHDTVADGITHQPDAGPAGADTAGSVHRRGTVAAGAVSSTGNQAPPVGASRQAPLVGANSQARVICELIAVTSRVEMHDGGVEEGASACRPLAVLASRGPSESMAHVMVADAPDVCHTSIGQAVEAGVPLGMVSPVETGSRASASVAGATGGGQQRPCLDALSAPCRDLQPAWHVLTCAVASCPSDEQDMRRTGKEEGGRLRGVDPFQEDKDKEDIGGEEGREGKEGKEGEEEMGDSRSRHNKGRAKEKGGNRDVPAVVVSRWEASTGADDVSVVLGRRVPAASDGASKAGADDSGSADVSVSVDCSGELSGRGSGDLIYSYCASQSPRSCPDLGAPSHELLPSPTPVLATWQHVDDGKPESMVIPPGSPAACGDKNSGGKDWEARTSGVGTQRFGSLLAPGCTKDERTQLASPDHPPRHVLILNTVTATQAWGSTGANGAAANGREPASPNASVGTAPGPTPAIAATFEAHRASLKAYQGGPWGHATSVSPRARGPIGPWGGNGGVGGDYDEGCGNHARVPHVMDVHPASRGASTGAPFVADARVGWTSTLQGRPPLLSRGRDGSGASSTSSSGDGSGGSGSRHPPKGSTCIREWVENRSGGAGTGGGEGSASFHVLQTSPAVPADVAATGRDEFVSGDVYVRSCGASDASEHLDSAPNNGLGSQPQRTQRSSHAQDREHAGRGQGRVAKIAAASGGASPTPCPLVSPASKVRTLNKRKKQAKTRDDAFPGPAHLAAASHHAGSPHALVSAPPSRHQPPIRHLVRRVASDEDEAARALASRRTHGSSPPVADARGKSAAALGTPTRPAPKKAQGAPLTRHKVTKTASSKKSFSHRSSRDKGNNDIGSLVGACSSTPSSAHNEEVHAGLPDSISLVHDGQHHSIYAERYPFAEAVSYLPARRHVPSAPVQGNGVSTVEMLALVEGRVPAGIHPRANSPPVRMGARDAPAAHDERWPLLGTEYATAGTSAVSQAGWRECSDRGSSPSVTPVSISGMPGLRLCDVGLRGTSPGDVTARVRAKLTASHIRDKYPQLFGLMRLGTQLPPVMAQEPIDARESPRRFLRDKGVCNAACSERGHSPVQAGPLRASDGLRQGGPVAGEVDLDGTSAWESTLLSRSMGAQGGDISARLATAALHGG